MSDGTIHISLGPEDIERFVRDRNLAKAIHAELDRQGEYVGAGHDLESVVLDGSFDLFALGDAIKLTLEAQGWTAPKEKEE